MVGFDFRSRAELPGKETATFFQDCCAAPNACSTRPTMAPRTASLLARFAPSVAGSARSLGGPAMLGRRTYLKPTFDTDEEFYSIQKGLEAKTDPNVPIPPQASAPPTPPPAPFVKGPGRIGGKRLRVPYHDLTGQPFPQGVMVSASQPAYLKLDELRRPDLLIPESMPEPGEDPAEVAGKEEEAGKDLKGLELPPLTGGPVPKAFTVAPTLPKTHGYMVGTLLYECYRTEPQWNQSMNLFGNFARWTAYALRIPTSNVIRLPEKVKTWTTPKSPFVHKKRQEVFWRRTKRAEIHLFDANPEVVERFFYFMRHWHQLPEITQKATTYRYVYVALYFPNTFTLGSDIDCLYKALSRRGTVLGCCSKSRRRTFRNCCARRASWLRQTPNFCWNRSDCHCSRTHEPFCIHRAVCVVGFQ